MRMRAFAAILALSLSATLFAQEQKPEAAKPQTEKKETAPSATLTIGDKAPALNIEKWVKGSQVSSFEKGKVYVIEFWATWCGPCIAGMPHLTEVQQKFKDKGVTVIGVTSLDSRGNTLAKVEEMVKNKGDEKMGYTVAWDKERKTNEVYMQAANQGGIPCAFVVNQDGLVAWIGHPMGLDEPLEQITTGKFDIKRAAADFKKQQDEEAAETAKSKAINEEVSNIVKLIRGGDHDAAMKATDEMVKKHPELAANLAPFVFQTMLTGSKEYEKAYAFAREAAEKYCSKSPEALNAMAWAILDADGVDHRDADLALTLAKKAVELTKESDGMILDTLALAHFQKGDAAKALELQKKALELVKKDNAPEEVVSDLKERLDKYEQAAKKKE